MIIIRTIHDVRKLIDAGNLPKPYLDHIEEFFHDMYDAYGHGTNIGEFTLKGTAEILILDDVVNPHGIMLPMIPGSPGLMNMEPEYVEKTDLNKFSIYRVAFMLDNERFLFIFSEVGQFDREVEQWLAEQWEWSKLNLAL